MDGSLVRRAVRAEAVAKEMIRLTNSSVAPWEIS